jgi:hypothetical protein
LDVPEKSMTSISFLSSVLLDVLLNKKAQIGASSSTNEASCFSCIWVDFRVCACACACVLSVVLEIALGLGCTKLVMAVILVTSLHAKFYSVVFVSFLFSLQSSWLFLYLVLLGVLVYLLCIQQIVCLMSSTKGEYLRHEDFVHGDRKHTNLTWYFAKAINLYCTACMHLCPLREASVQKPCLWDDEGLNAKCTSYIWYCSQSFFT